MGQGCQNPPIKPPSIITLWQPISGSVFFPFWCGSSSIIETQFEKSQGGAC